jgi:hypothetical protein
LRTGDVPGWRQRLAQYVHALDDGRVVITIGPKQFLVNANDVQPV